MWKRISLVIKDSGHFVHLILTPQAGRGNMMLHKDYLDLEADRDRWRTEALAAREYIDYFTLETIPGFEGAAMAHEKELYKTYVTEREGNE
jgi:hypothetical protein